MGTAWQGKGDPSRDCGVVPKHKDEATHSSITSTHIFFHIIFRRFRHLVLSIQSVVISQEFAQYCTKSAESTYTLLHLSNHSQHNIQSTTNYSSY